MEVNLSTKVSFCDLTHTGQLVSANTFPLGMAMVAAYAKKALGEDIDMELFKYPEDRWHHSRFRHSGVLGPAPID